MLNLDRLTSRVLGRMAGRVREAASIGSPLEAPVVGTVNPPDATYEYFAIAHDGGGLRKATGIFRTVDGHEYLDFQRFHRSGTWVSDTPGLARYALGYERALPITEQQASDIIRRWNRSLSVDSAD